MQLGGLMRTAGALFLKHVGRIVIAHELGQGAACRSPHDLR